MFTDSDTLSPKNTSTSLSYHHIASKTYFDVDLDEYVPHHWFIINITGDEKYLEGMYERLKCLKQVMIDISVPEDHSRLINASIKSIVHPKHDILIVEIMVVCTNDCYNTIREKFSNVLSMQIMSKDRKPVSLIIF